MSSQASIGRTPTPWPLGPEGGLASAAGGIWQALLTTALGMAVAIPVTAALSGFDAAAERLRHDLEALGADIFARPPSAPATRAVVSAPGTSPETADAAAWRAA